MLNHLGEEIPESCFSVRENPLKKQFPGEQNQVSKRKKGGKGVQKRNKI